MPASSPPPNAASGAPAAVTAAATVTATATAAASAAAAQAAAAAAPHASPAPSGSPAPGESLVRAIGTFGLAAGIINITIGGGIFRLPALVAGFLGPSAPIAYLVCALAMGLIVLCIADAGSRVSLTGGPYAYVGTAFGSYVGFLAGVLLWMLGTFATAAVSTVFASSVGLLVPPLAGRGVEIGLLVAAFGFWSLVNLRGVTLGVRLNGIATVAKLLPLLLVAIGGAFFIKGENLRIAVLPAAGDVARTSLLLIFAFAGIESALVPSGEVRDTARTVPRAIALAMVSITLLYVALQMVAQGIMGGALAHATVSPLADAAGASLGPWARSLLLAGATVSMFGYLGGMTLAMPRMLFALARDGFLPRALAAVHPIHRSPQAAIIAQSLITVALAASGTFEKLAILANVSALALYFGCALAAWRLRQIATTDPRARTAASTNQITDAGADAEPRDAAPFRMPLGAGAVVPWLACGVIVWLLTGLTRDEWLGFGACLALASVVYVIARPRGQRAPRPAALG
jgi:APA family basic amino acid/polyamine antiporter